METKRILLLFLLNTFVVINSLAQTIPLVYNVENTGANFAKLVLPALDELPAVKPLTDPFE